MSVEQTYELIFVGAFAVMAIAGATLPVALRFLPSRYQGWLAIVGVHVAGAVLAMSAIGIASRLFPILSFAFVTNGAVVCLQLSLLGADLLLRRKWGRGIGYAAAAAALVLGFAGARLSANAENGRQSLGLRTGAQVLAFMLRTDPVDRLRWAALDRHAPKQAAAIFATYSAKFDALIADQAPSDAYHAAIKSLRRDLDNHVFRNIRLLASAPVPKLIRFAQADVELKRTMASDPDLCASIALRENERLNGREKPVTDKIARAEAQFWIAGLAAITAAKRTPVTRTPQPPTEILAIVRAGTDAQLPARSRGHDWAVPSMSNIDACDWMTARSVAIARLPPAMQAKWAADVYGYRR